MCASLWDAQENEDQTQSAGRANRHLKELKAGAQVDFTVEKKAGGFEIQSITPASAK